MTIIKHIKKAYYVKADKKRERHKQRESKRQKKTEPEAESVREREMKRDIHDICKYVHCIRIFCLIFRKPEICRPIKPVCWEIL